MEVPILTADNFDDILAKTVQKNLPDFADLDDSGFILKDKGLDINKFDKESTSIKLNRILKQIPKVFQKHKNTVRKYWNVNSSYGCKHELENFVTLNGQEGYCTNGEFILAMLILGYEMKPLVIKNEKLCPNAVFNSSKRNLKRIKCDCGLSYTINLKNQHLRSQTHIELMINSHSKDTESQFEDFLLESIERLI